MGGILIVIIALYILFVFVYLLSAGINRKKNTISQGDSVQKTGRRKTNIVGKSTFDLSALKPPITTSVSLDATSLKPDSQEVNSNTFVSSDRREKVPTEDLDETFSETPADEENEPMAIDYSLEYDEWDEDEETEELEGTSQAALASGVSFEELGLMLKTVNDKEKASADERQAAGDTLLEIRRTDMFEQLVSGRADRRERVKELIADSLDAFYKLKDAEMVREESPKTIPDDFNIRDFI